MVGVVCVFWPNFHHIILKIGSNWCGICAVSVLYMVVLGGFCNDSGVERVTHFGGLKLKFCCWLCWACPVWCIVKPLRAFFLGGACKMIVSCFTDWVGFPQIGWEWVTERFPCWYSCWLQLFHVFWWSGMPDVHLGPGFIFLLTLELLYSDETQRASLFVA